MKKKLNRSEKNKLIYGIFSFIAVYVGTTKIALVHIEQKYIESLPNLPIIIENKHRKKVKEI